MTVALRPSRTAAGPVSRPPMRTRIGAPGSSQPGSSPCPCSVTVLPPRGFRNAGVATSMRKGWRYRKPPLRCTLSPLSPLVTTTSASPSMPGGVTTRSRVAPLAMTCAGAPPMVTVAAASKSAPSNSICSPPATSPARGDTTASRGLWPGPVAVLSLSEKARASGAFPALRSPVVASRLIVVAAGRLPAGRKVSVLPTVSSVPGTGWPLAVTVTFAATVAGAISVENTTEILGTSSGTVSPDCADVETTKKSATGPNESATPVGVSRADTRRPDPTDTAIAPPPATPWTTLGVCGSLRSTTTTPMPSTAT